MKYRHQYHAGNFADVHKHVLLLDILGALTRKDKGLLFVDTHAGRGMYELYPGDAQHPAEWQAGAAKLLAAKPRHEGLARYRELVATGVRGASLHYRGSPLLAMQLLRSQDRAVFFETQRDEAGQLRKSLGGAARARVESTDGFAGLRALLPPPERRGCILVDPPFEERADYARMHDATVDALQRFETAVLVLWLPVKLRGDFDHWFASLARAVSRPLLASLLWVLPPDSRAALNGSALVVANPPYLLEEGMREWLPELQALLAGAQGGSEMLVRGA
ncbi:MAG TPA: 23S rRNA (adenine(2030)-N(6))-methyltransferase RlmJ [Steroidobacteraceae bacterium]|jgi:23S rRNA (adenine2030-N6)-methyltransferase|nr:23S rRNA (adenine(2030)-N(6))-methyltransferase RlmJ [Steroidobacteraceae bacterium]